MDELIDTLVQSVGNDPMEVAKKFVNEKLRPLKAEEVPSSRDLIIRMLSVKFGGSLQANNGEAYRTAQTSLRNLLHVPEKRWRQGGRCERVQVHVFRYKNDNIVASVCTLRAGGEAAV